MIFRTLAAILFVSLFAACDGAVCKNSNPALDTEAFTTAEYRKAMFQELKKYPADNLQYSFVSYQKVGNMESILVKAQGADICVKMSLLVNDWTKLQSLRKEVSGYRGAALRGLKYDIVEKGATNEAGTSLEPVIVYRDVEQIVD